MKTQPSKSALQAKGTSVVDGFDRIGFWLDRTELPLAIQLLKPHCANVIPTARQPPFQANRKLALDLYQPTTKCLDLLRKGLGREVGVDITYVEIARDLLNSDRQVVIDLQEVFLNRAQMPYSRDVVLLVGKSTWYYNRDTENGHVFAIYADKPSKIHNARPLLSDPACCHIEWRAIGKSALATVGIQSVDDLIQFDFNRHWNDRLKLYDLPSKTTLGRKLARLAGGKTDASNPAYLKRGNEWIARHSKKGIFILQNALNSTPEMARRLPLMTWQDWFDSYTDD